MKRKEEIITILKDKIPANVKLLHDSWYGGRLGACKTAIVDLERDLRFIKKDIKEDLFSALLPEQDEE